MRAGESGELDPELGLVGWWLFVAVGCELAVVGWIGRRVYRFARM